MWGTMIDYWYYTKDPSYTDTIAKGILSQASPTNDFMMPNQHYDLVSATLFPVLLSQQPFGLGYSLHTMCPVVQVLGMQ